MEATTIGILVLLVAIMVLTIYFAVRSDSIIVEMLGLLTPDPDDAEADEREKALLEAEVESLKSAVNVYKDSTLPDLKRQIKDLEQTRRLEEEEIKHHIKLATEAWENEKRTIEIDLRGEKERQIFELNKAHLEEKNRMVEEQRDAIDRRFDQILARLPSANIEIAEDRNITRDQQRQEN